jgi:hypothetical protein
MGSAGIAQLVEQLICNQQVVGSNPTAGSGNLRLAIADCRLSIAVQRADAGHLVANCPREALEINPPEIFGADFCRAEIEFYFFDCAPEIFRKYFRIF